MIDLFHKALNPPPTKPQPVTIRWACEGDYPTIETIERLSYRLPWDETDLRRVLSGRRIGMVAEINRRVVVGYMVYELGEAGDDGIMLLRAAVEPAFRRRGIGRQMVGRLIAKLDMLYGRDHIRAMLRESSLKPLCWLRACGFRGELVRGRYATDDGIRMTYELAECGEAPTL